MKRRTVVRNFVPYLTLPYLTLHVVRVGRSGDCSAVAWTFHVVIVGCGSNIDRV
jgi:hypothetical protein